MMLAYMRTFQRMGLKAIPMAADTGPIGGDLSHEFIILAPTGESQVYYDAGVRGDRLLRRRRSSTTTRRTISQRFFDADDHALRRDRREARHRDVGEGRPARRREGRGIEVGHIFYFGTKYTQVDERHGRRRRTASRCIRKWAATASACRAWSAR